MDIYTIYFDGSCFPNPGGIAHYGFTVSLNGQEIHAEHGPIGEGKGMSNNVAEHVALFKALMYIYVRMTLFSKPIINIYGDSQMVINQVNNIWKARSSKLYFEAYCKTKKALKSLRPYVYKINATWIPREQNQRCDDLSKGDKGAK